MPGCVDPNACYPSGPAMDAVLAMQLVAAFSPAVIGLILGVPVLARERAEDTVAFALTQSVSAARWAVTRTGVALAGAAVAAGAVGGVFRGVGARYTILANDTYELLELLHLNHPALMVARALLTVAVAGVLGLATGSPARTAVLSVCAWPFGLIASCGGVALIPFTGVIGGAPDADQGWRGDISFADPFAWAASAVTAVYVGLLLVLIARGARRMATA
jgi:hypothetical protein